MRIARGEPGEILVDIFRISVARHGDVEIIAEIEDDGIQRLGIFNVFHGSLS